MKKLLPCLKNAVTQVYSQECGATLVYAALALPLLLALAALAIDGSNAVAQQRRIQNAADAAALAGVRLLALGNSTTQVQNEVQTLATANGADSIAWSYLTDNTGLQVTVTHTFATFFAGTIGYPRLTVQAAASAQFATAASADNLLPLTVMCDDMANDADPAFTYGAVYQLWDGDKKAPGNFGWLDWNGVPVGNNELADNIARPHNSGVWHIGDWIPAGPGVQNSAPLRNALNTWLNKPVIIPLYSTVTGNGANTRYQVCAFAQFTLLAYNFQGSNKWVSGKFLRSIIHSQARTGAADFGLRDVHLIH